MKIKRILSLASALLLFSLASCSGGGTPPAATDEAAATAEITTESADTVKETEEVIENINFRTVHGSLVNSGGAYRSTSPKALAVAEGESFKYGSLSVDLKDGATSANSGIVFGIESGGASAFWESGVSYYFYYVSSGGSAYLGKVTEGKWSALSVQAIDGYSADKSYTVRVMRDDTTIYCYVNGEIYFSYNDENPLWGSQYGIRTGIEGAVLSNVKCNSVDGLTAGEPDGFAAVGGGFSDVVGELMKSKESKSMAIYERARMAEGTVSVTTVIPSAGSTGIVFGLEAPQSEKYYESESGLSYYYYCANSDRSVSLFRVADGKQTLIKNTPLLARFSVGNRVTLKVIFGGGNIYAYADDICFVMHKNAVPGGDIIGLKATEKDIVFCDFATDTAKTPIQADIIVWGHSHMQLWANAAADLAKFGKVINLGVGSSNTPYWANLIDEMQSYNAGTMVVMTGSNDYKTASNDEIIKSEDEIYKTLKKNNPDLKIILITEFLQPCRLAYAERVIDLRERYIAYAAENDFVTPVDAYDIALTRDGGFNNDIFRDIYHLKPEGYIVLAERVAAALDGKYAIDTTVKYEAPTPTGEYSFTMGKESDWKITTDADGNKTYETLNDSQLLIFNDITFAGGTVEFDMTVPSDEYKYKSVIGVVFGATNVYATREAGTFYTCGRDRVNEYLCTSRKDGVFKWEDNNKVKNIVFAGKTYHYKFVWDSENSTVELWLDGEKKSTCRLSFATGGDRAGLYSQTKGVIFSNVTFK